MTHISACGVFASISYGPVDHDFQPFSVLDMRHRAAYLLLERIPTVSKALTAFESAIQDAEILLAHFDSLNTHPPPENAEVLKRAGLIMALTAWETYVEDCAREELLTRLEAAEESHLAKLVLRRFENELRHFHNPNSDRTMKLFLDYADVDVTAHWEWTNTDPNTVKQSLDELIAKRGDAVHRSKPVSVGASAPHLVKRDDLAKAIRFLKRLVEATEAAVWHRERDAL